MQGLVLDVDALSHGSGLGFLPTVEVLIASLPNKALIEKSVYTECVRTGVSKHVDTWMQKGLVGELVDYRSLDDADARFRKAVRRWPGLSKQDRASLLLAESWRPSGILTCEGPLARAATEVGVWPVDLFDVLRFGIRLGHMTREAAAKSCATWDADRFSAGRPNGYGGSFDTEWEARKVAKPLP
jgi:hypothetical protein